MSPGDMAARREKLIDAAYRSSGATEALMRSASQGGEVEVETLVWLAEAAKILIDAELMAADPAGETGQLQAALVKFLEGWAG
ncbi:MAG: hypothetical protein V7704_20770 [Aurantimonas endophytica]|uniref:hypothetical protein n=1 Tax=Aurantimonas endophytica TaxID=1522175 RepID=UPI0030011846